MLTKIAMGFLFYILIVCCRLKITKGEDIQLLENDDEVNNAMMYDYKSSTTVQQPIFLTEENNAITNKHFEYTNNTEGKITTPQSTVANIVTQQYNYSLPNIFSTTTNLDEPASTDSDRKKLETIAPKELITDIPTVSTMTIKIDSLEENHLNNFHDIFTNSDIENDQTIEKSTFTTIVHVYTTQEYESSINLRTKQLTTPVMQTTSSIFEHVSHSSTTATSKNNARQDKIERESDACTFNFFKILLFFSFLILLIVN